MGALHAGHLHLMRIGLERVGQTAATIFVNPTQFNDPKDFDRYPRTFDEDIEQCRASGVSLVFCPSVEEMYQDSYAKVAVSTVSEHFEGAFRPGHFDGVATIVTKLFHIVQPSHAIFGEKDLQQCAVIRALVHDLNFPIELVFSPTLREDDGLAMSSRNRLLTAEDRKSAPLLFQSLKRTRQTLVEYDHSPSEVKQLLSEEQIRLECAGFHVEYFDLANPITMEPTLNINGSYLVVASRLGSVRLIDNIAINERI